MLWRKPAKISVLADTHASGNIAYKSRKNSLTFKIMSKVMHNPFYKLVMKEASYCVSLVQDMAKDMINNYDLVPGKSVVIPLLLMRHILMGRQHIIKNRMILFLSGAYHPRKCIGPHHAFCLLLKTKPDARLVLLGNGEEEQSLKPWLKPMVSCPMLNLSGMSIPMGIYWTSQYDGFENIMRFPLLSSSPAPGRSRGCLWLPIGPADSIKEV